MVQFALPSLHLMDDEARAQIRPLAYVKDLDPRIANMLIQMLNAAFEQHPDVYQAVTEPVVDLIAAQHKRKFSFAIVLTDPLTPEERARRDLQAARFLEP